MDRRTFLRATGTVAATSASLAIPESAKAEGYRRCDQLHEKLVEAELDRWVTPLPLPKELPTRVITSKDDVQNPALGGGSQKIAPEFYWTFGDYAVPAHGDWTAAQLGNHRPEDIFRAEVDGTPAPLQYAELFTKAIVKEVIPGWFTRILCYGFKERNDKGEVTKEHFDTPGPTIHARPGHPLVVRLRNEIDPALMLDVSLHQHGGHIPAHSDGHPNFMIEPKSFNGESHTHEAGVRDYYYPNPVPKVVKQTINGNGTFAWEKQSEWDFAELQNTMWYHDHAEDITAHNALMGLAGYFFLDDSSLFRDKPDPTGPAGWRDHLPKKQIPLVFKDLCFCPIRDKSQIQPTVQAAIDESRIQRPRHTIFGEARIHFDPFDHNGTLGNIQVVNGAAYPKQEVKFQRYWLRMLGASLARMYNIEFWVINPRTNERKRLTFHRFGKDSWLFDTAIEQSSVFLSMAARADVCIDFAQLQTPTFKGFAGDNGHFEVMVVSTLNQKDGRGPGHGDNEQTLTDNPRGAADEIREEREAPLFLMKFLVKPDADDTGTWPKEARNSGKDPYEGDTTSKPMTAGTKLRHHHVLDVPKPGEIYVREFNFERGRGAWQINKRFYDACIANSVNQLWSTELWILRNRSGGWWHPIHIHLESHQQLFVRARNHRGQRIVQCRPGYDPKAFDPGLGDGDEPLDLGGEILEWNKTFNPAVLANTRHDAGALDFDAAVWNLGIKHDTTVLGPNTEVHVLMRFRTFEGPFVFHCHNLDHEDMRMMYQMDPRERQGRADEQLKVRPSHWYFIDPSGAEHCCEKTKGDHA